MTFSITKHNSTNFAYKDHAYKIYKPKVGSINQKALRRAFLTCEDVLSNYSKVCMLRIDLHPATYNSDNKLIKSYLKVLTKELTRKYECQPRYFSAREQDTSQREHYHLVIFLSGHKVNHSNNLQEVIKETWKDFSGGSTTFLERPYYLMQRGNKESIDKAIYRLSYLTKNYSKQKNNALGSYLFSPLSKQEHEELKNNSTLLVDPEVTRTKKLESLFTTLKRRGFSSINKTSPNEIQIKHSASNITVSSRRSISEEIEQFLSAPYCLIEFAMDMSPNDYVP